MKKENILETKKLYTAPKMDVVELKHETSLLNCSDNPDAPECVVEGG